MQECWAWSTQTLGTREEVYAFGVQERNIDIIWGVTDMWMAFKAMRLAEITKRMNECGETRPRSGVLMAHCIHADLAVSKGFFWEQWKIEAGSWSLVVKGLQCYLKELELEETILVLDGLGGLQQWVHVADGKMTSASCSYITWCLYK